MKAKLTLLVCMLVLALLMCGCAGNTDTLTTPTNSNEPPKNELALEALEAYSEILDASPAIDGEPDEFSDLTFDYEQSIERFGPHIEEFALVGLRSNGVPELFTQTIVNSKWVPVCIYTYVDGKAVFVKNPQDSESRCTFEQRSTANGTCYIYFCEDKHIHNVWRGTAPDDIEVTEDHAYVLDGTTLTEVQCDYEEDEDTLYLHHLFADNTYKNMNAAKDALKRH